MAFFAGTEVGIQGYASLSQIGVAKFSAFISAYFNTREVAPLVSAIALAATVGCGYTARLGAMRISEEIDALEVMGIPSLPFLVTTRMIAAFIAVIPLYIVALGASYLSPRLITTLIYGQSPGTYDHYFLQFLPPIDMLWSFFKLLFLAVAVILIHCYYGYTASGGPAGVGMAVGRAIRTSIVTIVVADFFLSFAIWGSTTTVRITGLMLVNIYHDSPREHRRLLVAGVAFLTAIALLIGLSIAIYQKTFERGHDGDDQGRPGRPPAAEVRRRPAQRRAGRPGPRRSTRTARRR